MAQRASAIDGLRLYLADKLLSLVERGELAKRLSDAGPSAQEAHLRTANEGLKSHLSSKAVTAISIEDAPGPADQQLIGEMIRSWMKHDPLSASRRIVDAIGLGGAYRLPEGERREIARAFLAMLDIAPAAEGDQTAVRRPSPSPLSEAPVRSRGGRRRHDDGR